MNPAGDLSVREGRKMGKCATVIIRLLFSIITPVPAPSPSVLSTHSDLNGAIVGTAATADLAVAAGYKSCT